MKKLLLIRHGLPHEGHPRRPHDPPLHSLGRRHADRLARRLEAEGIDRIVCSPQQRAMDTAAPLARRVDLALEIHEHLAEVDHGSGEAYRSVENLRAQEPHRWAEFLACPARFFSKDPDVYEANVVRTFEAILADPRGTRVAVFSHGMTIKTLLCAALRVRDGAYARFSIAHCSVSRVSGRSLADLRVDSVNECLCKPVPHKAG